MVAKSRSQVGYTKTMVITSGLFWSEEREVTITGTIDPRATPTGGAIAVILVSEKKDVPVAGEGIANGPSFVIVGSIAAAGAIIGWAINDVTQPSTPASQ